MLASCLHCKTSGVLDFENYDTISCRLTPFVGSPPSAVDATVRFLEHGTPQIGVAMLLNLDKSCISPWKSLFGVGNFPSYIEGVFRHRWTTA